MEHQVWGNNWEVNNWLAYKMRNLASIERYVDVTFLFRPARVWLPQPVVSRIEKSMATSTHIRIVLKPHYLFISNKNRPFVHTFIYSRSSQLLKLSPMSGNPRSLGFSIRRRWFRTQVHILDSGLFFNGTWTTDSNLSGIPNSLSCIPRFQSPGFQISWLKAQPIRIRLDGSHIPVRISILHLRFAVFVPVTVQTNFVTFFLISFIFCCRLKATSLSEFHSNTNSLRCNDTK